MRVAKVNVYSVKELTGKAKEAAITAGRTWHNETFDSDDLTEDLKEHAEEKHGVIAEECSWRLSNCQGDGVAFYGHINLDALEAKYPEVKKLVEAASMIDNTLIVSSDGKNSRYHHWNSMTVEVEADYGHRYSERYRDQDEDDLEKLDAKADKLANDLRDFAAQVLKDASRDTERYGYQVIDGSNEDESIVELLEANEWEFDENGRVFSHPEVE